MLLLEDHFLIHLSFSVFEKLVSFWILGYNTLMV